ncbi:hypothetical protein B0I35DRAFT_422947 [Stachybotrys elegans]|uniref:Uncharacterized protein n=1 Tax=Stachybotrys elegans TaxID=80388 RepID=A0A8K0SZW2_9HYPO|nr:hypothetical protein B0I35DRAFT_422947 [Stachybotrys elegans]
MLPKSLPAYFYPVGINAQSRLSSPSLDRVMVHFPQGLACVWSPRFQPQPTCRRDVPTNSGLLFDCSCRLLLQAACRFSRSNLLAPHTQAAATSSLSAHHWLST